MFDNCNNLYVKYQLQQTDECEDTEEVALPLGAVSDFVAIRWDNEWFPGKSKNLYIYQFL